MKNYVSKFAIFVALSCGFALAQSMPQQQSPQSAPTSPSASQPAPDQSTQPSAQQPSAQPDQSAQPSSQSDQQAKPDEKKSDDQSSKMPQSDTAAAGGDVQNQVQSAIQQDPKLANANITVSVNGKNLELNGTVPSGDEKKQAEKIAKSNAGSLKVKNHIKVANANAPASDKSSSAPPKY